MGITARPFLMFEGNAEEAMKFYVSRIPGSEIVDIRRYGKGGPGPEGSVLKATFSVAGQTVMCTDSFVKHEFSFTPSFSFWIECESTEQILEISSVLAQGGDALMPLDEYGFSRKFAWIRDRFGISWQLNFQ